MATENDELMKAVYEAVGNRLTQMNNYIGLFGEMKQMMDAGFTREEAYGLLLTFIENAHEVE